MDLTKLVDRLQKFGNDPMRDNENLPCRMTIPDVSKTLEVARHCDYGSDEKLASKKLARNPSSKASASARLS